MNLFTAAKSKFLYPFDQSPSKNELLPKLLKVGTLGGAGESFGDGGKTRGRSFSSFNEEAASKHLNAVISTENHKLEDFLANREATADVSVLC